MVPLKSYAPAVMSTVSPARAASPALGAARFVLPHAARPIVFQGVAAVFAARVTASLPVAPFTYKVVSARADRLFTEHAAIARAAITTSRRTRHFSRPGRES